MTLILKKKREAFIMKARILGTGSYAPVHVMSNDDIAKLVDTNDDWIEEHTGIRQRYLSSEGTVSMATQAAKKALDDSGIALDEIDMILVATVTPDYSCPNTACQIQAELGMKEVPCIDLSAACTGFVFAMNTANAYITSGMYKTILVVGAETLSKIVDWADRATCILFGDGAGAIVMQASEQGIIATDMGSDGSKGMVLYAGALPLINPIVERTDRTEKLSMDGSEVFKFAVRRIPETIKATLEKVDKTEAEVDYFILHQANRRIIEAAARRLDLAIEKFPMNIDKYGNLAAASVPILLDELNRQGKIKRGQLLMVSAFGAGLGWGSALLEW